VKAFPASEGKWQISKGGGSRPRWNRNGKELFYLATDGKIMAVEVKTGASRQVCPSRCLRHMLPAYSQSSP
jgi:hypothetical protein